MTMMIEWLFNIAISMIVIMISLIAIVICGAIISSILISIVNGIYSMIKGIKNDENGEI